MLSGIGPAEELKKHGIAPVQENHNVGQHLKDHLTSGALLCRAKPGTTLDYLNSQVHAIPALLRWMTLGTGPLTSNVAETAAFCRSSDLELPGLKEKPVDHASGSDAPDLEIICAPTAYIHHGEEKAKNGESIFSIGALNLRPQSTGTVTLQSRNVFDPREYFF